MQIPFNKPYATGKELDYIKEAYESGHFSGDGVFTKKCSKFLEDYIGASKVLLTHSCTAALEMTAILANISEGDEVILPSFTFVSSVNAFVLRGAVPVFVDIRADTLNIDETKIEECITSKTKAIVVVHYAGVACEMAAIQAICKKHNILLIEDAAHGISSFYDDKHLGSLGDMATLSFHETKNIISGEGGALLINDNIFSERAEIIREKGTNRNKFLRGLVDKYTWVDIGSSYLPSEIIAAFLYAQLQNIDFILEKRLKIWQYYYENLVHLEYSGFLRLPVIPSNCKHNGHMFYILVENVYIRDALIKNFRDNEIGAVFHYIPLHNSPAGIKFSKNSSNSLAVTEKVSETLIRLPFWIGVEEYQDKIIEVINKFYQSSLQLAS